MTPEELKIEMMKLLKESVEICRYTDGHGEFEWNHPSWADDPEDGHGRADGLMVATLRGLGYGEAMDIYEMQPKWYA